MLGVSEVLLNFTYPVAELGAEAKREKRLNSVQRWEAIRPVLLILC